MTTTSIAHVGQLRSQIRAIDRSAEDAFERAFDLQQAGAPEPQVQAALAESNRLQERARQLREQLGDSVLLH